MLPTHIVLHHSTTEDSKTLSWGPIRNYHVNTNGWSNIGYHYGIEVVRDGLEILCGKMPHEQGIHCPQNGMNRKAIAICMVGNFDKDPPSQELLDECQRLIISLILQYNIPVQNVTGHREHNRSKSCPGKLFDLNRFRSDILNTLNSLPTPKNIILNNSCSESLHDIRNAASCLAGLLIPINEQINRIEEATLKCGKI